MNYLWKERLLVLQIVVIFLIVVMATPKAYAWPPYDCPPSDPQASSEEFDACRDYELKSYDNQQDQEQLVLAILNGDMPPQPLTCDPIGSDSIEGLSRHLDCIDAQVLYKKSQLREALAANFTTPDSASNFSSPGSLDRYLEAWDKNQTAEKQDTPLERSGFTLNYSGHP